MVPLLEKGLLVLQTTPYPKSGAIFSSFAPEAAQVADTPVHTPPWRSHALWLRLSEARPRYVIGEICGCRFLGLS
jgi:hypothetical protein